MTNTHTSTPPTLYAVVILDGDNFGEFIQHGGIFSSFDEADREGQNIIQEHGDNDPMEPGNLYYEVVRTQIDGTAEVVKVEPTTQHPAYPADFPAPLTLCKALKALAVVVEDCEGENAYSKLLDTLVDARQEIEGWFTDHLASNAPLFIDSVIAEAK